MEDLKDRDIFTLSSGERQKIAFLAATALNPQIYVLDEPSANLDIHTILQVREILFALKADAQQEASSVKSKHNTNRKEKIYLSLDSIFPN